MRTMLAVVMTPLFDTLRRVMTRRQRVVNPADPTEVITWEYRGRFLRLSLIACWDVEAEGFIVTGWSRVIPPPLRHRSLRVFRSYGSKAWARFYDALEGAHARYDAQFDEDPMGRLADYE